MYCINLAEDSEEVVVIYNYKLEKDANFRSELWAHMPIDSQREVERETERS